MYNAPEKHFRLGNSWKHTILFQQPRIWLTLYALFLILIYQPSQQPFYFLVNRKVMKKGGKQQKFVLPMLLFYYISDPFLGRLSNSCEHQNVSLVFSKGKGIRLKIHKKGRTWHLWSFTCCFWVLPRIPRRQ